MYGFFCFLWIIHRYQWKFDKEAELEMIISYDSFMDWYSVSSEGVSHSKVVRGPRPDEPFDKTAPNNIYNVFFSLSKQKWMCPCEAYRFSKFTKHCKHIRNVIKYRLEKGGIQKDDC